MSNLLLVEPSATMRNVLATHARSLGFSVSAFADYFAALEHLSEQFDDFERDIGGVLLGWPTLQNDHAEVLIDRLEQPDLADLPVVVMSTDMRAATRAWVAGRDHTAVLHWKHYQRLGSLLEPLLADQTGAGDVFDSKFDNSDIHLLIVDDSVSIRHSLRDLFELQGYRLTLASSYHEALTLAQDTAFDIAVLDFYLQDGSGDQLCRELLNLPGQSQLTCTILTGTYADHIIRRSLRAGAVECMFKNESSELLLARVDAISRFVRQRKRLHEERALLDRLIDLTAGAVLLVSEDDTVRYTSPELLALLGHESLRALDGEALSTLCDINELPVSGSSERPMRWQHASGEFIQVSCRVMDDGSVGRILQVRPVDESTSSAGRALADGSDTVGTESLGVAGRAPLPAHCQPFVQQLQTYLDEFDSLNQAVSLLRIESFEAAGQPTPVEWVDDIERQIGALITRQHHLARVSDHALVVLLRHDSERHGWLLTRHLLQQCNAAVAGRMLACTGCLVSLSAHRHLSAQALLTGATRGCSLVNERGVNLALLLDVRRLLPVYPEEMDAEMPAQTGPDPVADPDKPDPGADDPGDADPSDAER